MQKFQSHIRKLAFQSDLRFVYFNNSCYLLPYVLDELQSFMEIVKKDYYLNFACIVYVISM